MVAERSRRDQSLRGLLFACVVGVLAAAFGWWLRDVVSGLSHVSLERGRAKLALSQEPEHSNQLDRQLANALQQITLQAAALKKAADKTAEIQQLAEVLQEERGKADGLARDLAAARREIEMQAAALEKKAADKTAEIQQLAVVLQEERGKADGLAQDLAAARREIETQAAALEKKAADKTAEIQQVAEVLQEERGKTDGLVRDFAAARREIEMQAGAIQQLAEMLQEERGKADGLARDLAAARREIETQAAALKKAADKTAEKKELRGQTVNLLPKLEPVIDKPVAARQSPTVAPPKPEERLMARARQLVEQGNISAARSMLERAADGGNARAIFALAETYDSNMLSAWGTVGMQGDATKAEELYRKALAGGVEEANARLKALHP
jgi:chromosome segregation ATPase